MAYMRVYQQIPILGTEGAKTSVRAQQATTADPYPGLEALMAVKKLGCDAVPTRLGYGQGTQQADDIVPGGYITYVIWDKVPGDFLTQEQFWNRTMAHRISFVRSSVMPTSKPICSILLRYQALTH